MFKDFPAGTATYTIGKGCVGSGPNGRCTIEEFLRYIWEPREAKDETQDDRPKKDVKFELTNREWNWKFKTLFDKINKPKYTGDISPHRLFEELADIPENFYPALAKSGEPIAKLQAENEALEASEGFRDRLAKDGRFRDNWALRKKIVDFGQSAAKMDVWMRLSQLDSMRFTSLKRTFNKEFGGGKVPEIFTEQRSAPLADISDKDFRPKMRIDFVKTITSSSDPAKTREVLENAFERFKTDKDIVDHMSAAHAAFSAQDGTACKNPVRFDVEL
ncbi:hypothetical protein AA313_de0202004 [Arthrobotrys entomopaga]|nr:hypothetical protein AA313_de0202004 [Arthrobotrys entomopaga]